MTEPIINRNDSGFFTFIGFTIAMAMWCSENKILKFDNDGQILLDLCTEHIPNFTMLILLFVIVILSLSSGFFKNKKYKNLIKNQCNHLSNRLVQFCSPAFFLVLGLSIGTIIVALSKRNIAYVQYLITFLFFAGSLYVLAFLGKFFVSKIDNEDWKLTPKLSLMLISAFILYLSIGYLFSQKKYVTVEVKLERNVYDEVKKISKDRKQSISKFIEDITNKVTQSEKIL